MESTYDEDLSENPFFKILQDEYKDLFDKATSEGWIICVPRAGSMPKYALTPSDFFSHVLIPNDELPETHFRTLSDKEVRICNRVIFVEDDMRFSTHVLFEETFYTTDMLKYKILCVEFPLKQYLDGFKTESGIVTVLNLRDCIDLLWTEGCKEVLEKLDEKVHNFLTANNSLELKPLQELKDLVGSLYTKCLQSALRDPRLREKTSSNRYLLDNVKVSVESYVHHGIYSKLIKGITACTAYDDATFNKTIRNLSDIQLRDLNIGPEFQSVIPKARSELRKIEGFSTAIGKLGCLKNTISAVSNENSNIAQNVLAADDLLPMIVFLIIKSGIPNWVAHLTFMKEFSFSNSGYHSNQQNFLVTSLEAAITYVQNDLLIGPPEPECQINYEVNESDKNVSKGNKNGTNLLFNAFQLAKSGRFAEIEEFFERKETPVLGSLEGLNLCHPLCSCDKCEKELSLSLCNMSPTVNSCDDKGFTVLHVAAMYGHAKVVDALLRLGAKPNKTDYRGATALHYSSARGHQNTLLVLAHGGAKLDSCDNEGNTPLHCAALNGHESCVKAILYYTEYTGASYNIDCLNNQGETALHHASRWGYSGIVTLLLEYGASPLIENKRKCSPQHIAHNIHILKLLTDKNKKSSTPLPQLSNTSLKNQLDFTEETSKKPIAGVRPSSTEEIRKIERILRAIKFGDIRLACFYLGLEYNVHKSNDCHPLCTCETNDSENSFGEAKTDKPLDVDVCDSDGFTPLHEAAKWGRTELLKLLINSRANLNVLSASGMTPFHLACQNQKTKSAELLLDTGLIDANCKDSSGNTGLHYAALTNNQNLVKLLVDFKADPDIRNSKGETPVDIAKQRMLISTVKLFMSTTKK